MKNNQHLLIDTWKTDRIRIIYLWLILALNSNVLLPTAGASFLRVINVVEITSTAHTVDQVLNISINIPTECRQLQNLLTIVKKTCLLPVAKAYALWSSPTIQKKSCTTTRITTHDVSKVVVTPSVEIDI